MNSFKKIFFIIASSFLVFTFFFIFSADFLKDYYEKNKKNRKNFNEYNFFKKSLIVIAEFNDNLKNISFSSRGIHFVNNTAKSKHKNKQRFKRYIKSDSSDLLLQPRFDFYDKAVIELIDTNNFNVLHSYRHDFNYVDSLINHDSVSFKNMRRDNHPDRFEYWNAHIDDDASIYTFGYRQYPLIKFDLCGKIIWIKDTSRPHHSIQESLDEKLWLTTSLYPYSKIINNHKQEYGFNDHAIEKIDKETGKTVFLKSISEILVENNVLPIYDLLRTNDPIHLNKVEEAKHDTKFYKKGDLFLSLRNLDAILHFRPANNKVINYIKGPFYRQHDVDILDEKIIIFNNNNSIKKDSKYSQILIYDLETKEFSTLMNDSFVKYNIKTVTAGLQHVLSDKSVVVWESNHGRILKFNKNGKLEFQYVNKSSNGVISNIGWGKVIEDKNKIISLKEKINENKCN
jgi:hypothetical protein